MNDRAITDAINESFWFGGSCTYPWQHSVNRIKNCAIIHLDSSPYFKFKIHKNGKLRLMKDFHKNQNRYLDLQMKPLQTITHEELVRKILACKQKYGKVAV